MNYAEIKKFDIANAPGICTTIFFSGCTHRCEGCFNQVAQDFNYGQPFTPEVQDKFLEYAKNSQIDNICILGGEPLQQNLDKMYKFIKKLKKQTKKPIWLWTGYTWEQLVNDSKRFNIIKNVDILVDGKFEISQRDLSLRYRGSHNQRVIDVKATIKNNFVYLLNK